MYRTVELEATGSSLLIEAAAAIALRKVKAIFALENIKYNPTCPAF